MPVRHNPLLDWECLAKIFSGHGLQLIEYGRWVVFPRGDAIPLVFPRHAHLGPTEVNDLFANAGLDFEKLDELIERYCSAAAWMN